MPDRHHQGPPWGGSWGAGPRRGAGRHMFRRIAGFLFFLLFLGGLAGAIIATGFTALAGGARWLVIGLTGLALIGFGLIVRGLFRRNLAPVGALVDATQRLGDGDTGVRLATGRPGPFAAVFASFNRMAQRLETEEERRRRLLADIGHELRTPMTVIRGEIEAVLDGVHAPESLSNVIDEVGLVERLLEDLRVLAVAEAGSLRLETEPTDLAALARDVVASFSKVAADSSVTTTVVAGAGLEEVDADPHRLHQVFSNLVANALNQMPDGGTLEIAIDEALESVVITFADSGPGIEPDQLERIFERFVRSGDTRGTGLGLSISRDLVEAHGGTITADNAPGGGARFTVTLPRPG